MLNISHGLPAVVRPSFNDGGCGQWSGRPPEGTAAHPEGASVHHGQDEEGRRGGRTH